MTPSKFRLVPLALSLLVSSLAMAQERAFVQIGSIVGDSTDPAHSGWIDAYALDNKLLGPPPPVGGGSEVEPRSRTTPFSRGSIRRHPCSTRH